MFSQEPRVTTPGQELPTSIQPVPTLSEAIELQDGEIDPRAYRIGPGDGLIVVAWGAAELNLPLEVDPEGRVFVPSVGLVRVAGLSLHDAREEIRRAVLGVYSRVQVDVLLRSPRRFKVHVAGEGTVAFPGSYPATAVTRVSEVLDLAGGLGDRASRRLITMTVGGVESLVDLTGFRFSGRLDKNPYVVDGAVITVPRRTTSVLLSGSVLNPGPYEPLPGERLSEMLAATGGLAPGADTTQVLLFRFGAAGEQDELTTFAYEAGAAAGDPVLRDGDRVYFREIAGWHHAAEAFVYGAVVWPGRFPIPLEGEKLSRLLERAGGLTPRASLDQGHILRSQQRYARATTRETYYDYGIDPAAYGETDMTATLDSLVVECNLRALLVEKDAEADVVVHDGDVVRIPEDRREIRVLGRVRAPGSYPIREGASVSDYIGAAGGYDRDADKNRTSLARFDGGPLRNVDRSREPASGSIIYVPARERTSGWQRTRDVVGFVVQVASLAVIVDRFVND